MGGDTLSYTLSRFLFVFLFGFTLSVNARDIYITPDTDGSGDGSSFYIPGVSDLSAFYEARETGFEQFAQKVLFRADFPSLHAGDVKKAGKEKV